MKIEKKSNLAGRLELEERLFECLKDVPSIVRLSHMPNICRVYNNISEIWLYGEGERVRMMRLSGVKEKYLCGECSDYEKFREYCRIMPSLYGHPLYFSDHEELREVFGCELEIDLENCDRIWELTSSVILDKCMTVGDYIASVGMDNIYAYRDIDISDADISYRINPIFDLTGFLDIRREGFAEDLLSYDLELKAEAFDRQAFEKVIRHRVEFARGYAGKLISCKIPEEFKFIRPDRYHADILLGDRLAGSSIDGDGADMWCCQAIRILARECERCGLSIEVCTDNCNMQEILRVFDYLGDIRVFPKILLRVSRPCIPREILEICHQYSNVSIVGNVPFYQLEEYLIHYAEILPIGSFGGFICADKPEYLKMSHHAYVRALCRVISSWSIRGEATSDISSLSIIARKILFENISSAIFGENM